MSNKLLELLFNPGEGICYGDFKATDVYTALPKAPFPEFFSINPLNIEEDKEFTNNPRYRRYRPRRADLNVTLFRNFMFEMDSTELEVQKHILQNCGIPWSSVTFSGSKSYHAILSLERELVAESHSYEGVEYYKYVWRRLAAKIDRAGRDLGHEFPEGQDSFIDSSCKNASRLSRLAGAIRDSNGSLQELVHLDKRISELDFADLISACPKVYSSEITDFDTPIDVTKSEEAFFALGSSGLHNKIKYFDEAGEAGMYPKIYRLALWAIDETNVDKETLTGIMEKYLFPRLLRAGYPAYKLYRGIESAYRKKRIERGEF